MVKEFKIKNGVPVPKLLTRLKGSHTEFKIKNGVPVPQKKFKVTKGEILTYALMCAGAMLIGFNTHVVLGGIMLGVSAKAWADNVIKYAK